MHEQADGGRTGLRHAAATHPRYHVEVHHARPALALIRLRGDLDAAAAPELDRSLSDATTTEGVRLVVDMEQVASASAEAVDVLLRAERRLAARGGAVELLAPSPSVVLMLHAAG